MHLEARGLTKLFASLRANDKVSFEVKSGEILGLIGENGAGKSTCMNMLFGYLKPDSGEILIDGVAQDLVSPRMAIAAGIGMVHQHFVLASAMTAFEHLLLAAGPGVKSDDVRSRAVALMHDLGFDVELDKTVAELEVGKQQQLEVLRVLYQGAKLLILDEPTAVLSPVEVEPFLQQLDRLKQRGHSIILISHKLDEVVRICDSIVVMRGGRVVHRCARSEATIPSLAAAMVGEESSGQHGKGTIGHDGVDRVKRVGQESRDCSRDCLRMIDFKEPHGRGALDLSLTIDCGEIVGVAGVDGNGQEQLFEAILRIRKIPGEHGSIQIGGNDITRLTPYQVRRRFNIGVLPFDRCSQGLLPEQSSTFNLMLNGSTNCRAPWWINWRVLADKRRAFFIENEILPVDHDGPVGRLSGGNQQKFLVAREFETSPELILASHPTRGVDWRSANKIHDRLIASANRGAGVLLVSSDVTELMKISDRILVMLRGKICAEFSRDQQFASGFDFQSIGRAMTGGSVL